MRFFKALTAVGMLAAGTVAVTAAPAKAEVTVYVWASNVNVRTSLAGNRACTDYPSARNCPDVVTKVSKQNIVVYCQKKGQPVSDSGYSSEWWSYMYAGYHRPTSWISNVYIRGKAHLDGVPDCTF
ncbi:hypothetical protein [Actinomadura rudentiformis]|uniref:Secreted protein n=1 Tax=Actinomadura rudentiformis TaxID=359158 RepID=A0A6H9YHZ8_9ACTN|nr:hypothetical protein [Actinomadura rudentiformis]KAB2340415.1 hypothetical protein F8566_45350 [Actinomadura rudentiformis]